MVVNEIYTVNIDKLIEAYKNTDNTSFGYKSNEFFENTQITLRVSKIQGIELIFLRKFCPSMIVISGRESFISQKKISLNLLSFNEAKTDEEIKMQNELKKLSDMVYTLSNNLYSKEKNDDNLDCLDCGSMQFEALLTFKGMNIVSLLDTLPELTLFNRTENRFYEIDSKAFKNMIIKQFFVNFFNFMENYLSCIDTLTDVSFSMKYFSPALGASLSFVRSSFGSVSTNECNNANDFRIKLNSKINVPIDNLKNIGYNINDDISYHFSIRSTMKVFTLFMAYSNLVYHFEDLKTISGVRPTSVNPVQNDMLEGIFSQVVNELDSYRLETLKKLSEEENRTTPGKRRTNPVHYKRLELYEFIPKSALICFMIHGTKKEINDFLNKVQTAGVYPYIKDLTGTINDSINLIEYLISE